MASSVSKWPLAASAGEFRIRESIFGLLASSLFVFFFFFSFFF